MHRILNSSITDQYHQLLEHIMNNGIVKTDRTGTGTVSVFDWKIVHDMKDGFPLITTKKIHVKSVIHELLWFLSGNTNIKYLKDNGVTIWDEWADEDGNLGPVYGKQWVNWGSKINQIQEAIDLLKNNPDSRRILVSAWNVGELDDMALHPCHWSFELYTEELSFDERIKYMDHKLGLDSKLNPITLPYTREVLDRHDVPTRRLSLKYHQRSVDTFLGLPFNIASYAFLLHMFAQQVNMIPGVLVGDLTNVHIYDNHIKYAKEQLERNPHKYDLPQLKLTKADDIFSYKYEDFHIDGYDAYPNWKNVPIAV